jgi:acyl carrier protein
LDVQLEVLKLLGEVLGLGGRAMSMNAHSPLLGAVPELDSMAVVAILSALEERFGVLVEDDEVDGDLFATVGSLTAFAEHKLAG